MLLVSLALIESTRLEHAILVLVQARLLTYYPDLAVVVHYGFGVHDLIRIDSR